MLPATSGPRRRPRVPPQPRRRRLAGRATLEKVALHGTSSGRSPRPSTSSIPATDRSNPPATPHTMPRIPRVRGLSSLQTAIAPSCAANRASLAARAALSTSARVHGKNTDWIRGKLWKGEAPGPEDPYTQRMEPEDVSNLPEEARDRPPHADHRPAAVQKSRLALPPRRTEAVAEKELQALDPTYVPATELDGLDQIKPLASWWQQPGHWGQESRFRGFAAERVEDKALVELYMRRAVVETLALQQAGLLNEWAAKTWPAGRRAGLDQTLAVDIVVQDGKATLKGDLSAITKRLTGEVKECQLAKSISAEEAQEIVKAWDASWKEVALDDYYLKFAVRPTPLPLQSSTPC